MGEMVTATGVASSTPTDLDVRDPRAGRSMPENELLSRGRGKLAAYDDAVVVTDHVTVTYGHSARRHRVEPASLWSPTDVPLVPARAIQPEPCRPFP